MPRLSSLVLLVGLACVLCATSLAAAQGSTSTTAASRTCNAFDMIGGSSATSDPTVTYPSNSVAYLRQNYTLPPETFFIAHWYVGIIIIVLVVGIVYVLLGIWICYHFEFCDQRRAKKVVLESYVTKGYFDIDRYVDRGIPNARAGGNEVEMRSSSARSFRANNSYDGGSYDSYSDEYSDDNSSPSDEDNAVVQMNPLRGSQRERRD